MIQLDTYWPLALLPLIPLIGWLHLTAAQYRDWRARVVALLSMASLGCFVFALAQPSWQRESQELTLLVLVDTSRSVSDAQLRVAEADLAERLSQMDGKDRILLLTFAQDAVVSAEQQVSQGVPTPEIERAEGDWATDIESALRTALALLDGRRGRILLLSDGQQTMGDVKRVLPLLRARGISVDVWPMQALSGPEMVLTRVRVPGRVAPDRDIPLKLSVSSLQPTMATLTVEEAGWVQVHQQVTLVPGEQLLQAVLPAAPPGFHRYQVDLTADADTLPANNRAIVAIQVEREPRYLYVTSQPGAIFPQAVGMRNGECSGLETGIPSELSTLSDDYADLDALVLDNVPASELPAETMQAIASAVRMQGMGLLVLGQASLGPAGYRGTPIEEVLPVELVPPERKEPRAILIVIDRSGSMGGRTGADLKINLARAAVASAIRSLAPMDQVGVIAFDALPHPLIQPQKVESPEGLVRQLGKLTPGHGTRMQPALEMAADWFGRISTEKRYLVVLSDGKIPTDDEPLPVVEALSRAGVRVSALSFGMSPLMQEIAQSGHGSYRAVTDLHTLPQILLQELNRSEKAVAEGEFIPEETAPHPAIRGLDRWPKLYGYIRSRLRAGAQTILAGDQGEPLLAFWRYGAGRVMTFQSDLNNVWGRDWVRWGSLGRFLQQSLDSLSADAPSGELTVTLDGTEGIALVGSFPEGGGEVLFPSGEVQALTFSMEQGQWQASFPVVSPGDYRISVGENTTLLPVAYPPEWTRIGVDRDLLSRLSQETEGRFEPSPQEIARRPQTTTPAYHSAALWQSMLWLGILLFLAQLAARHISFGRWCFEHRLQDLGHVHETLQQLRSRRASPHGQPGTVSGRLPTATLPITSSVGTPRSASPLTSQLLAQKQRGGPP